MKLRTSFTLSEDLVAAIDRLAGRAAEGRDARDTAAINHLATNLDAEMKDALSFQAPER